MRLLYAYYSDDPTPRPGSKLGALSYHGPTQRGFRSLYLMEKVNLEEPLPRDVLFWDLRNPAVSTTVHLLICVHWSNRSIITLCRSTWIHSTTSHPVRLRYISMSFSHLLLGLRNGIFPSRFPNKILYEFRIPHACYMPRPSLLDLITLITFG
jgi:hypothetical protein